MSNKYIGCSFDDFLEEEGLLAEVEAAAIKRVIAHQIAQLMASRKISKAALAKKMKADRVDVERLLDPGNETVTLQTLERAALALGKRLHFQLV